ncbi:alpha/beta hydrolase [Nocardia brasiliensis]
MIGRVAAIVGATGLLVTAGVGDATAAESSDPIIASGTLLAAPHSADGSRIDGVTIMGDRYFELLVYAAAMDKYVRVKVQRPADTSVPRPTLYLLSGASGGAGQASWRARTAVLDYLATKEVNVIEPLGGAYSYYTDWRTADPVLGVNKWRTFLTEELPLLIDGALGTNGTNAIAGLSMAGTSVLQLPIAKPGLFAAAAAYSGCAQLSDPIGYTFASAVVRWGGGDAVNMYGPQGDPMWAENDPFLHADRLRGVELFISSGFGLPGEHDALDGEFTQPGIAGLLNQVTVGGVLEAATGYCADNLRDRLDRFGIPATYDIRLAGTHSWGYWEDALVASWPVLARGLGVPG